MKKALIFLLIAATIIGQTTNSFATERVKPDEEMSEKYTTVSDLNQFASAVGKLQMTYDSSEVDLTDTELYSSEKSTDSTSIKEAAQPEDILEQEFQTKRIIVESDQQIYDEDAVAVVEGYRNLYILQYSSEESAERACIYYDSLDYVTYAEADRICSDTELEEKSAYQFDSWGAESMGVSEYMDYLKQLGIQGKPTERVTVAIVDTGIDLTNEKYASIVLPESRSFVENVTDVRDDEGHGTAVASVIQNLTMDNVDILAIKALDKNGLGTELDVYLGIMYAVEQRADIINLSLGAYGTSELFNNAIQEAYNNNILCVAAAGNGAINTRFFFPANVEEAITVAALNEDNTIAYFSNYGDEVDLAAPGVGIATDMIGGGQNHSTGTSIAAPHVTALAALLKTYNKSYTPEDISNILEEYAIDLGEPGKDEVFGCGKATLNLVKGNIWNERTCRPVYNAEPNSVFNEKLELSITSEPGAQIYYSIDGSLPDQQNGILYTDPISLTKTTTVRAIAYHAGKFQSEVSQAIYYYKARPELVISEVSPDPDLMGQESLFQMYDGTHIDITFDERVSLLNTDTIELKNLQNDDGTVGSPVNISRVRLFDEYTLRIYLEGGDSSSKIAVTVHPETLESLDGGKKLSEPYTVVYSDFLDCLADKTDYFSFAGLVHCYFINEEGNYVVCYTPDLETDAGYIGIVDKNGVLQNSVFIENTAQTNLSNTNATKFYKISSSRALLYYTVYDFAFENDTYVDKSQIHYFLIDTVTGNILDRQEIDQGGFDSSGTSVFQCDERNTYGRWMIAQKYVGEGNVQWVSDYTLDTIQVIDDKISITRKWKEQINQEKYEEGFEWRGDSVTFEKDSVVAGDYGVFVYGEQEKRKIDISIGSYHNFHALGCAVENNKLILFGYPYSQESEAEDRGLYEVIVNRNYEMIGYYKVMDYYSASGNKLEQKISSSNDAVKILKNGKIAVTFSRSYTEEIIDVGTTVGNSMSYLLILDATGNIISKQVYTRGSCSGLQYDSIAGKLIDCSYRDGEYRFYNAYEEKANRSGLVSLSVSTNQEDNVYPSTTVDAKVGSTQGIIVLDPDEYEYAVNADNYSVQNVADRFEIANICANVNVQIELKSHNWDAGVETIPATCTTAGEMTYTCKNCAAIRTEEIPVIDHNWDAGVITKPATATTDGLRTYTCVLCGGTKTEKINRTGAPKKGTVLKDNKSKAQYIVTKSGLKGGTASYSRSLNNQATKISIPATIKIDGITYKVTAVSDKAFQNNKKLVSIVIGSNVSKIGDKAFYKCTKLSKATLGKNLATIGKQAFYGCKKLATITITSTKLTGKNIGSKAFTGINSKAVIKVPKSKQASYKKILKAKGVTSKMKIK